MIVKSGYYIVYLTSGNEKRVKADNYNQAVNKVIEKTDYRLEDIIDANPEYIER